MPYATDVCIIRFAGRLFHAHIDLCKAAGFTERTQWLGDDSVYATPTYAREDMAHGALHQALSEGLEGEAAVIRAGVVYRQMQRDQLQYETARMKLESTRNFRANLRKKIA